MGSVSISLAAASYIFTDPNAEDLLQRGPSDVWRQLYSLQSPSSGWRCWTWLYNVIYWLIFLAWRIGSSLNSIKILTPFIPTLTPWATWYKVTWSFITHFWCSYTCSHHPLQAYIKSMQNTLIHNVMVNKNLFATNYLTASAFWESSATLQVLHMHIFNIFLEQNIVIIRYRSFAVQWGQEMIT